MHNAEDKERPAKNRIKLLKGNQSPSVPLICGRADAFGYAFVTCHFADIDVMCTQKNDVEKYFHPGYSCTQLHFVFESLNMYNKSVKYFDKSIFLTILMYIRVFLNQVQVSEFPKRNCIINQSYQIFYVVPALSA